MVTPTVQSSETAQCQEILSFLILSIIKLNLDLSASMLEVDHVAACSITWLTFV